MKVRSNAKQKAKEIRAYGRQLSRNHLKGAMFASLEEVANVAVGDFMRPGARRKGEAHGEFIQRIRMRSTGKRLRVRTGRLASSVLGTWRFSKAKLPSSVQLAMRPKERAPGGGERESIREVKIGRGKLEGIVGSTVPYARIHEFGGTIHHTNLFGRGIQADISMPERPYLRPAVEKARPSIVEIFGRSIQSTWDQARI